MRPVVSGEHEDVVALTLAPPQPDRRLRRNPALGDDLVEHRLRILEQAGRAFPHYRIVEDGRIVSSKLPGAEERRPVDRGLEVGERPIAEMMQPRIMRRRRLACRVEWEGVGARLLEGCELALPAALARLAQLVVIVRGRSEQWLALGVRDQRRSDTDGAARVEDVDDGALIGRVDPERGVRLARRRAADQQRSLEAQPLHLAGDGHHLVQRRRNQAGQADHVGIIVLGGLQNVLPRHHHAEVDDFETVALQDDADDVLADVVNVAFDRRHHDPTLALRCAGCFLLLLDEGDKVRDRPLHDARGLHDLRQEHLARSEQVADDVHSVHQRPFDHLDRPRSQ